MASAGRDYRMVSSKREMAQELMQKVLQPDNTRDTIGTITADPTTHATIVYYTERRRSLLTELKALDQLLALLRETTHARPEQNRVR